MRKYETRKSESTFQVLVDVKCDICGATSKSEWKETQFDATEVEVRLKTGSSYPEGGSGDETTVDLCPSCFQKKLIPWIQSQGGTPTTKPWD